MMGGHCDSGGNGGCDPGFLTTGADGAAVDARGDVPLNQKLKLLSINGAPIIEQSHEFVIKAKPNDAADQ